MDKTKKVYEQFKKLEIWEKNSLILEALRDKELDFNDISQTYVKYLEFTKKVNEIQKRLLADGITGMYSKYTDMQFVHARNSLLLHPYVPDEYIGEYILKKEKVSKKELDKARGYIQEQITQL